MLLNKIISNIPFQPSLVEQLAFYSKRLQKEESIRRVGFILIALSMLVQILAATLPAERSLAASNNDIIKGGAYTKKELLRNWDASNDVSKIYKKFGLTRKDIANLSNKPNVNISTNQSNYWSIGRHSLGNYGINDSKERSIQTAGPTVFIRPLAAWGHGTYAAYEGRSSLTGKKFWIIANCGNFTQNGPGTPPPPKLEVQKSIVGSKKKVQAGDTVKFRIEYRNKKQDSLAENVRIVDKVNRDKYQVVSPQNVSIGKDDTLEKKVGNLKYTKNSKIFDIKIKVKNNLKNGTKICNSVKLTASNAKTVSAGGPPKVCVEVFQPPEVPPTSIPPPPTIPPTDVPEVPPGLSKEVKNVSQSLSGEEAISTKVKAGDVIEYSLITYNGGQSDIINYEISDYIGDILDYADLNTSFLAGQSGQYDAKTKTIKWTNQTLKAGEDNLRIFRVTMKDPLPSTNKPANPSTDFDCKINNIYGDEVSMDVDCPVIKNIEQLPNTGPGTTIFAAFTVTSLSGYFFARSNVLAKELFIIRKSWASSGK